MEADRSQWTTLPESAAHDLADREGLVPPGNTSALGIELSEDIKEKAHKIEGTVKCHHCQSDISFWLMVGSGFSSGTESCQPCGVQISMLCSLAEVDDKGIILITAAPVTARAGKPEYSNTITVDKIHCSD